ncbi:MAG TPA: PAS domain-containing protein, partial [Rhodothermales bacterium]|nr:PAS domain-containing protein [Rhodothermales bacterium]
MPVRSVPPSELESLHAQVEALQAENQRLRATRAARPSASAQAEDWVGRAFRHAPFPAIVHADDGEVLALSDGFVQGTGYRREDIRRIEDWLERAYGEHAAEVGARIRERFETGAVLEAVDVEIRAADGRMLHWICSSSRPEPLADGRQFSVVMAADVTARDAVERTRVLLAELDGRLRLARTPDDVLTAGFSLLPGVFGEVRFAYAEIDADEDRVTVLDSGGPGALPIGATYPLSAFLAPGLEPDFAAGRPLVVTDVQTDPRTEERREGFGRTGTTAFISVPVLRDGRLRGMLSVVSATPRVWTPEEVAYAEAVGARVAPALDRVRAESALRSREEQLRLALDAAGMGTWRWDLATRTVEADATERALWGFPLDRALTMDDYFAQVHPDDVTRVRARVEEALATCGDYRAEYRIICATRGNTCWLSTHGRVECDEAGQPLRLIGVTYEVTTRKLAEQAIQESEARFRDLADAVPQIVMTFSADGRTDYINRRWYEYTGETPETSTLESRSTLIHPEDLQQATTAWADALQTGEGFEAAYRIRRHDGEYRWHLTRVVPVAYGGDRTWITTSTDIQSIREAEEAVRESEAKFRALANTIPQLAWMADPTGWIFWYNARWYEYTGTTTEQMEGWGWQSVHDPDVLPRVIEQWKASLETGTPFEMEFPLRGADGVLRPFLTRVAPLRDKEGRILRWFGTNTDVTAIREMETALRKSEERFRALADAVPQIVYVIGNQGKVEYLNARWYEYTGADEGDGMAAWNSFTHPDDLAVIHDAFAVAAREGLPYSGEIRLRGKDDQYRWHLTRVTPMRD